MNKLKILHVYKTYYPDTVGGVEEVIRQIMLSTQPLGIESRIFALSKTPSPRQITLNEGQIWRARSWGAPASCDIGGLSAFSTFQEAYKWADILHFHFPWPFADLLSMSGRLHKPKILTYHSDIVKQRIIFFFYQPLMYWNLNSMDALVATSPAYVESSKVLSKYIKIPGKLHVIPLGVDEPENDIRKFPDFLSENGIAEDSYVLSLGVLRYYKGLHILLNAARKIRGNIVVAGSGPEENNLKLQVRQLGLKNVFFAGRVDDEEKMQLIKNCRAMVLASHLRSEAYGMVLVEASMQGKAMVTCEIGTGTSFVNKNEVTGLVVKPNSPDDLAVAINSLLEDKELADRYGASARKRYEDMFSAKTMGKSYASLYREILER